MNASVRVFQVIRVKFSISFLFVLNFEVLFSVWCCSGRRLPPFVFLCYRLVKLSPYNSLNRTYVENYSFQFSPNDRPGSEKCLSHIQNKKLSMATVVRD